MKNYVSLIASLLLIAVFSTACDMASDDDKDGDGASLVGEWTLVSMVDKTGELFGDQNRSVTAGEAATFTFESSGQQLSAVFLVEGGLVFTQTNYEVHLDISITIPGVGSTSDSSWETGTYSVDGRNLLITSDSPEPGEPNPMTLTWSFDGPQLILEDDETRMRFSK